MDESDVVAVVLLMLLAWALVFFGRRYIRWHNRGGNVLDRVKSLFKEPPAKLTPTEQAEVLSEVLTEKLADVPTGFGRYCTSCGKPMRLAEGNYVGPVWARPPAEVPDRRLAGVPVELLRGSGGIRGGHHDASNLGGPRIRPA